MESGGLSAASIARNSRAALEPLRMQQAQGDVFATAKWGEEPSMDLEKRHSATKPSLSLLSRKHQSPDMDISTPLTPSIGNFSGFAVPPGHNTGSFSSTSAGHLDSEHLMPPSARRPREGIQPETYPFETLS